MGNKPGIGAQRHSTGSARLVPTTAHRQSAMYGHLYCDVALNGLAALTLSFDAFSLADAARNGPRTKDRLCKASLLCRYLYVRLRVRRKSQSPSPCSSTASTPTGDQIISNWKLFNDLENREEAEALELSLFLHALVNYIPGLDGVKPDEASDDRPIFQPETGNIDIANMYVQGNELDKVITLQNVENLIDSCRNGRKIPRNVVVRVVTEVTALLRQSPTMVEFTIAPAKHVTIIGDLHGQLDDLLLIFRENGLPSKSNPYVFNGDFVDRGDRGVEIAVIIYLFKLLYPGHVLLNRGNHEENSITQLFGFMKECDVKYDRYVYDLFCESFRYLPLATLIDERVLVVHGGVPRDNMLVKDFNTLDRAGYDLARVP
uniref:Serine/threonine-protein phosphatase n=1 Tax=Peronospora matthiolae TaxID=2874970 RepID=A0AAV1VGT1_9STRA